MSEVIIRSIPKSEAIKVDSHSNAQPSDPTEPNKSQIRVQQTLIVFTQYPHRTLKEFYEGLQAVREAREAGVPLAPYQPMPPRPRPSKTA